MQNIKALILLLVLISLRAVFAAKANASTLDVDTDYRIRGILYTNNDFNNNTSTDALAYYSQMLHVTLTGKFNEGVEICTRLSAIGVAGSTTVFTGIPKSSSTAVTVPYPSTDFSPYIDYAYIKIKNLADTPLTVIAGKQPMTYGNGLVISDNGTGMFAFRIYGKYNFSLPIPKFNLKKGGELFEHYPIELETEVFTAKLADGLTPGYDHDLYGIVNRYDHDKYHIELSFFEDADGSGSLYIKGPNAYNTSSINKNFIDFYITRKEDISSFRFEIAKENGSVQRSDGAQISLDGLGYNLYGELIGDKTKLGKVTAHAMIAFNTGDNNPSLFANDSSFNPSQTKRFDGLERTGYGELFAASPYDATFALPSSYSGIDALNVGVDFSPIYGWNLGVDYFYFAASEGPDGAPDASGFEKLYGANFALGVEMDLYAKYTYSKFTDFRISYDRYTPPQFAVFWPTSDPATRYMLEMNAKF